MSQHKDFARSAAVETAPRDGVGAFVELIENGDAVFTYSFESKLKGYRDWRWTVVIFAPDDQAPTVSEVLLMPGENSLVAPDWVPWSERLADYRALQAELEAQAALEAEEAQDEDDEESQEQDSADDSADDGDTVDDRQIDESQTSEEVEDGEDSAVSDADQADEPQDKANSAGKRPKRLFGWRKPRVGKKNNK